MERPVSIVWFERCYLGAILVGLVNTAVRWPQMMAQLADNPSVGQLGPSFAPTVAVLSIVLGVLISLLLWFFTARRRAVVTKWIITIFFVLSLLAIGFSAMMHTFPGGLSGVLSVVALVLNALAVWSLFRPDAEAWFAGTAATPTDAATPL